MYTTPQVELAYGAGSIHIDEIELLSSGNTLIIVYHDSRLMEIDTMASWGVSLIEHGIITNRGIATLTEPNTWYDQEVRITRSGRYKFSIDGHKHHSGGQFLITISRIQQCWIGDLYGGTERLHHEEYFVDLEAGRYTVRVQCTGKNASSTNYHVNITTAFELMGPTRREPSFTVDTVLQRRNEPFAQHIENPQQRIGIFVTMQAEEATRLFNIGDLARVNERGFLVHTDSNDDRIFGMVTRINGSEIEVQTSGFVTTPTPEPDEDVELAVNQGIITEDEARVRLEMQGLETEIIRATLGNMRAGENLVVDGEPVVETHTFTATFTNDNQIPPIEYPPMKCACCANEISHPQNMEQLLGREETLSYLNYCKDNNVDPQLYCCGCFEVIEKSPKAINGYRESLYEYKLFYKARSELKQKEEKLDDRIKELNKQIVQQTLENAKIPEKVTQFKAEVHAKHMSLLTKLGEKELEKENLKQQYEESISKLEYQLSMEKIKSMLLDINPLAALLREKLQK